MRDECFVPLSDVLSEYRNSGINQAGPVNPGIPMLATKQLGIRRTAFEAFKTLRNLLRKLSVGDVVKTCILTLNHPQAQRWERMRYFRPWEILLLLKWALLHCEWDARRGRAMRGESEFIKLVILTGEVINCARLPSEYDGWQLFLRNVAYQQFWLQEGISSAGLARQSFLFGNLPDNHRLRRTFRENLRMDIPDFIEMSLLVLSMEFAGKPLELTAESFGSLRYSQTGVADAFLKALSLDVIDARRLAGENAAKDINWELFARTPFRNRPLLRVLGENGRPAYFPLSRKLLSRTLELFAYQFLRSLNAAEFMEDFGPLFERYVLRLLDYAGLQYWSEKQLISVCPGQKVVDAFIRDGVDNIFLDAKGIEFPEMGMITHLGDIVRDRAKPSILKAIDQAYSSLAALTSARSDAIPLGSGNNYLFVITMQDTFLGSGSDFFQIVGEEELTKIQRRYPQTVHIPPDRMYFAAIQDLEMLCSLTRNGATTFSVALEKARTDDSKGATKKFVFGQHLLDLSQRAEMITFLQDELDRLSARCEAAFGID